MQFSATLWQKPETTLKQACHLMLTAMFFLLQLDSADEQAAAIRRELDGRMQKVAEMEKVKNRKSTELSFHIQDRFQFLNMHIST
jgi:hypothetical protein